MIHLTSCSIGHSFFDKAIGWTVVTVIRQTDIQNTTNTVEVDELASADSLASNSGRDVGTNAFRHQAFIETTVVTSSHQFTGVS